MEGGKALKHTPDVANFTHSLHQVSYEGVDFFDISECDKGWALQEQWGSESRGFSVNTQSRRPSRVPHNEVDRKDPQAWAEAASSHRLQGMFVMMAELAVTGRHHTNSLITLREVFKIIFNQKRGDTDFPIKT